ncbi:Protein krasavietz [Gryllus bimaculatus]|nr:Protein krasavietz [Gryllus bimaculatus]
MSQKAEKPVLSGQRIKTRKRDEKEKYDPTGFRDTVLQGLNKAGSDLEAVSKFLDTAGSKLDYRRYGEALFDILIAGGLLVPGGSIAQDGDKPYKTNACVFEAPEDMESMHSYEQEHLVKDNLALDFLMEVFVTWKQEKGITPLTTALKKGGIESRLMEFVPMNKRTEEYFRAVFEEKGLADIVKLHKAQASQEAKRDLQSQLEEQLSEGRPIKDIVADIKETAAKSGIQEHEMITLVWSTVMSQVEWNKKEELVAEQALKHLKQYTLLFEAFTTTARSELALMLRIQEYCYGNMNFMKVFQKIILLFYKTDVLSEEVILKWYKEGHSMKGKMMFLDQMKKFVEWLQNAEEESESGEEED